MLTKDAIRPLPEFYNQYIALTDNVLVVTAMERHSSLFTKEVTGNIVQLGDRVYAKDKWTARDIIQHLIDTERILAYRALRIARNDQTALPGFEGYLAGYTNAQSRSLSGLLDEFQLVRQASLFLFRSFNDDMLMRTGTCNGTAISALALGYVIAGHPLYHLKILHERYFPLITNGQISIAGYRPDYLPLFESLNRAWIEKDFSIEPDDEYVLSQPQKAILEKGGAILFAIYQERVIGTVGLQRADPSTFEMIKMAVDEDYRGRGTGQLLIRAAIEKAKMLGAKRLILHSNRQVNVSAVRLYRKLGFTEVPLKESRYKRADIKMEMQLNSPTTLTTQL